MSSSTFVTETTSVFEIGNYKTILVDSEKCPKSSTELKPPKPILIGMPEAGEFPVLLLLHGYLLCNSFYSQLIQHVASHGFIVIAPQLYTLAGCDTSEDIYSTATITNWLSQGLKHFVPPNVHANLSKLALAGHSRGGKTSFAVALNKGLICRKFSALIGIDPVAGMTEGKQSSPPVFPPNDQSFDLDMPVMVIGSGLNGNCTPKGISHEEFYKKCEKPACYLVAKEYGHMDMLNDNCIVKMLCCICKGGKCRGPMRKFVGGVVVAFMNAYLKGDDSSLMAIKDGHGKIPVELEKEFNL
ncbi:hypothetical protein UlMin_009728 [Ulmus minor]